MNIAQSAIARGHLLGREALSIEEAAKHCGLLLAQLDTAIARGKRKQKSAKTGQLSIFDGSDEGEPIPPDSSFTPVDVTPGQVLLWEKDLLGIYFSGHPLDYWWQYENCFDRIADLRSYPLQSMRADEFSLWGIIGDVERKVSKKSGNAYIRFELSDRTGQIDVLCFHHIIEFYDPLIVKGNLVTLLGRPLDSDNRFGAPLEFEDSGYADFPLSLLDMAMLEEYVADIEGGVKRASGEMKSRLRRRINELRNSQRGKRGTEELAGRRLG